MDGYLHLDYLRPGKALIGEVSLSDAEPCINEYRSIGLLIAGRNCSPCTAQQDDQTQAGLAERLSAPHQPMASRRPDLVDVWIPVTEVMSQAHCIRMESWRDTTIRDLILIVGAALLPTVYILSAGPALIAHIILVHVQRVAHDIRADLGGLLSTLHSFSAGPILITHIIFIYVQRLTHDLRTDIVALLSNLELIILLGPLATLSAFGVLHFGLQEYLDQSLRKGHDRQCNTHPKRATSAELFKIAHQFFTAVRFDEGRCV